MVDQVQLIMCVWDECTYELKRQSSGIICWQFCNKQGEFMDIFVNSSSAVPCYRKKL